MSYWDLNYHLVWATKNRDPLLVEGHATLADRAIRATCRDHGAVIYALGFMPDHVHLAVSIPPRIAVAELIRLIKGGSSHLFNHEPNRTGNESFAWQSEYGALSFGQRSRDRIVAYVNNQPTHHAENDLWKSFERIERIRPDPVPTPDNPNDD